MVYDCVFGFTFRNVFTLIFILFIPGFLLPDLAAVKTALSCQGHQAAMRPCFWAAVMLESRLGALSHGGRSLGRSSRLNITFLGRQAAMKTEWLTMHMEHAGKGRDQDQRKIVGAEVNIRCWIFFSSTLQHTFLIIRSILLKDFC